MSAPPLDPRFTFENFVVGKPNELANAAARRVAEAAPPSAPCRSIRFSSMAASGSARPISCTRSPGTSGARSAQRKVIYLSAEKFMYQFIRALRFKDTMAFKEQFRSVDVLMIDDVQFISGKDSTQEEFFHTFNALVDQNRQVVVSADKSPSDLEGMEDRLKSRLGWGLVADIHPTTYELRLGILQAKAEQTQAEVPQKVLEFLAHKITSNVRELEGALNRISRMPSWSAARSRSRARRRCCTTCCARTTAAYDRRDPEAASPSTTIYASPTCIRPAAPAPSPGRARWLCISASS